MTAARRLDFFGANAAAFNSREPEVLLSGAAGTGKSVAALAKCLTVLSLHPGTRVLFCRKTRRSLNESGLVTWERDVLGLDHPILRANPNLRRVRQSYDLGNGSEFVVCGMDRPDKALSSDYDLIYVQEATDLTLVDWETLATRLRTGVSTFRQMLADCNPTTPTHWLYRRHLDGKLKLYQGSHKDNPRYFDRAAGTWTRLGEEYLARLRGSVSGSRLKRFYEGVWAEAEGLVYDAFAADRHLTPAGWRPPAEWTRVWSLDWGFTNPLVLQSWAVDGDGRVYLEHESYKTRTRVEDLARWARGEVDAGRWVPPAHVVCDHDPECQATFEAYSGYGLTPADKVDRLQGLQAVQARFDRAGDGRPRIFFAPDALCHPPDPDLHASGRPTATLEELAAYAWDTRDRTRDRDEPLKANDHAMDAMRYACRLADATYSPPDGGYGRPAAPRRPGGLDPDTFR